MTRQAAITATGLKKSYGEKTVLDGVDISVDRGTVYALLGPNGAGKTTIVEILSTLIPPDSGSITVADFDPAADPDAVRRRIGVTGQFSAVDDYLTGRENLLLMADLHRLGREERRTRTEDLLAQFDLGESSEKLASTYSGGMRRKLDLAMTLIGRPEIIFLDEPTTGLDPRSRRMMWQIIRQLVGKGVTIFLTTQYLDEADQLADHIAVLDQGRIVAEGTAAELKRQIPGGHIRLRFSDSSELSLAAAVFETSSRDDAAYVLQIPSDGGVSSLRTVLDRLDAHSIQIKELSVHTPDLDDVFLTLTDAERTDPR